ncbi:MAG: LapA family protein [Actinomycetota bacterium]|nr:LapA family protein [Actinomycetota bacterium]
MGVGVGLLVLILVLVFIIQNLNDAGVHYLGLSFRLPVGLLILIGAVAGGLIVMLVSLVRVIQLRVRARRAGPVRHHDLR